MKVGEVLERFFSLGKTFLQKPSKSINFLKRVHWSLNASPREYSSYYRNHINEKVKKGIWTEEGKDNWGQMGHYQLKVMIENGLDREDRLLDIGCGPLRAGIKFIEYLEEGNYTGMDVSDQALDYGKQLLKRENLFDKNPTLVMNTDLRFEEIDKKFDYIIAQSVLTHLPPQSIRQCLSHIKSIMKKDCEFLATTYLMPLYWATGGDFGYPFSFFKNLANENGLNVYRLDIGHPQPQNWIKFKKIKPAEK